MKVREGSSRMPLVRGAALLLLVAAGCGDDVPKSQLVTVTEIAPGGADCGQRGGVSIQQGADKNKNGTLDPSEVTTTTVVCEGPGTDPGSLITVTMIPEGSATCPYGGTQIDTGLDNGDGGGTAGNGTLESGEIDATNTTCAGPAPGQFNDVPPSGAPGTGQILLNGGTGTGTNSTGGAGGSITMGPVGQSPSLFVFRTGTVDASFTVPTITITAGANPLVVASGTKQINPLPGSPTLNEFYLSGNQLVQHTASGDVPVTSISVAAGATLSIGNGSSGTLVIDNPLADVSIDGTLTTTPTGANVRPSLTISCRQFVSGSSAVIDLHGPAAGSAGGDLTIETVTIPFTGGALVNRAAINTSGTAAASGGNAGAGGDVQLGGIVVYNTGAINASGADQTVGAAASGGSVNMVSLGAGTYNSGAIDTTGGDGSTSAGAGGSVQLQMLNFGAVFSGSGVATGASIENSGAISTSGGAITSNVCPACAGGDAGSVAFTSTFPSRVEVRSSGAITARGGTTAGAGAAAGGDGGGLGITTYGSSVVDDTPLVDLSGTIDLSGGGGFTGGPAGQLNVTVSVDGQPLVRMLGYSTIQLKGGNAVETGGTGGQLVARRNASSTDGANLPRTRLLVDADVILDGGDCSDATGCSGGAPGALSYAAQYSGGAYADPYLPAGDDLRVGGSLSMIGGDGTSPGAGLVGFLILPAVGNVTVSGGVTIRPGATLGAGDGASNSGILMLTSAYGSLTLSGALDLRGRDSTGAGGGVGGNAYLTARHVVASSSIDVRGGNGAPASTGGSGGFVTMISTETPTTFTGTVTATGGTGMTAGQNGVVSIDGVVR